MLVCPVIIAPALLNFLTAVESMGALKSFRIRDAAEDCIPFTKILSLMAIGIPSIGDNYSSKLIRHSVHIKFRVKTYFSRYGVKLLQPLSSSALNQRRRRKR